jgi:hypothetical protein
MFMLSVMSYGKLKRKVLGRCRELYLYLDRQPPNATLKRNWACNYPCDFPCGKGFVRGVVDRARRGWSLGGRSGAGKSKATSLVSTCKAHIKAGRYLHRNPNPNVYFPLAFHFHMLILRLTA